MLNTNIDLGQILVASLIAIVGYFVKRELNQITTRLDRHDSVILDLIRDVSTLIGRTNA